MTGKSCLRLLAMLSLAVMACPLVFGQDVPSIRDQPSQTSSFEFPIVPPSPVHSQPIATPPVDFPPIRPPHLDPVNPRLVTLRHMTQAAGIIFSGQVVSANRSEPQPEQAFGPNAAPTSITFQIEDGILGASTGQRLTIHEWAGLWNNGEHYRAGERVFLFL